MHENRKSKKQVLIKRDTYPTHALSNSLGNFDKSPPSVTLAISAKKAFTGLFA